MAITLTLPSPLEKVVDSRLQDARVTLYLKRDDLINPDIPGNKWRKLHLNLEEAKKQGYSTLLTFGGAYSNHLRAVAAAGKLFDFTTTGIVRGEEHSPLNWSLQYASDQGMQLHYISREAYRHKTEAEFLSFLKKQFGDFYLLPEGGSNALAVCGCAEIPAEIPVAFDVICAPVGTGGTIAGIASGLRPGQEAIGFSALKVGDFLQKDIKNLQKEAYGHATLNWSVETNYHFGGFAKTTLELLNFIDDFKQKHDILLERIYVAKMLFGIFDLCRKGYFPSGSTIVAVITGPAEKT